MGTYSGKYHKGYRRELREQRRVEAKARNLENQDGEATRACTGMKVEAYNKGEWDEAWGPTPQERLLLAIFGAQTMDELPKQSDYVMWPPPADSEYGSVDPDSGDVTYNGATMIAGVDF